MPTRNAEATWTGTLRDGEGKMAMQSGSYEGPYSFQSRFEEGAGTNPEELIAAAHAGCFSMALSGILGNAGHDPERIETSARVRVEPQGEGFAITRIDLTARGSVPGIDEEEFRRLAKEAKDGCPVSKALGGVDEINVEASLGSLQQPQRPRGVAREVEQRRRDDPERQRGGAAHHGQPGQLRVVEATVGFR